LSLGPSIFGSTLLPNAYNLYSSAKITDRVFYRYIPSGNIGGFEAVMLLTSARELTGWDLGWVTDWLIFFGLPQSLQANSGKAFQIIPWPIPSTQFPMFRLFTNHPTIWHLYKDRSLYKPQINKVKGKVPVLN
jgi:hypothetical protein